MLSTPPAFILSQDQTLIKSLSLRTTLASNKEVLSFSVACLSSSLLLVKLHLFHCLHLREHVLGFPQFHQCCSLLNFHCRLVKPTTRIFRVVSLFDYQRSVPSLLFARGLFISDSLYRISLLISSVNTFLYLFQKSFL